MIATVYRRKLPHVRIDGAVYFITWRVRNDQPDLSVDERDCTVSAIRHFANLRYILHAYVIMNDHVHVLVQPFPGRRLEDLLRTWKSFTANRMQREFGRAGAIWQEEYCDRIVRDDAEYEQKWSYILNNPRKRWPGIDTYRWSWGIGAE